MNSTKITKIKKLSKKVSKKNNKKVSKQQQQLDNKKLFDEIDNIKQLDVVDAADNTNANTIPDEKTDNSTQDAKTANQLVEMAEEMYKTLKDLIKERPEFVEWEDKRKLDHFRERLDYKEFMTEYPVVTRYMICMGQYSSKAYRRMLDKIRMTMHPPAEKREKGYMEDQYVRRNADYIRYLWEAYKKNHYNTAEAKYVWEEAYKTLKSEFDDFRDKYKELENTTKEEKEKLKADNAMANPVTSER